MIHRLLGGMVGLYRVVPVNEAHIRILMNNKDIFCSRETYKSAYWVVPFITKLHKLPLSNLAIPVNDIKLNDKNMAKFVCDIMCFINIKEIGLAVERLTLSEKTEEDLGFDFTKLSEDLRAIMESVGRTVVTKHTILEIYMNRQLLDQAITKEVEVVFPKWGIELVDLELKDIKDVSGSTIIQDIERKVAAEIRKDAEIKVAETTRDAEVIKAQTEETYKKRQIEKDETIAKREQEKLMNVAIQAKLAKLKEFEVIQVKQVRQAEIDKEQALIDANKTKEVENINKEKKRLEGMGDKEKLMEQAKGNAEKIRQDLLAEAEGKDKLQEVLRKFDEVAIRALTAEKLIDMQQEIGVKTAESLGNADLKVFAGSDTGRQGFDLAQLISATAVGNLGTAKAIVNKIARPNDLGFSELDVAKAIGNKKGK